MGQSNAHIYISQHCTATLYLKQEDMERKVQMQKVTNSYLCLTGCLYSHGRDDLTFSTLISTFIKLVCGSY